MLRSALQRGKRGFVHNGARRSVVDRVFCTTIDARIYSVRGFEFGGVSAALVTRRGFFRLFEGVFVCVIEEVFFYGCDARFCWRGHFVLECLIECDGVLIIVRVK